MLPVCHSYVLNLNKRQDKWLQTRNQFHKLNIEIERFEAIDGDFLNFNEKHNLRNQKELACLLSHRNILEDAKKRNFKSIAIFEDDVLLHKNFPEEIKKLNLLPDYDLVYLGASQKNWEGIEPSSPFYTPNNTLGAWAFIVKSQVFDYIINEYNKLEASTDLTLAKIFSKNPRCYVAYPNICICDVTKSDLRTPFNAKKFAQGCKWEPENYNEPTA